LSYRSTGNSLFYTLANFLSTHARLNVLMLRALLLSLRSQHCRQISRHLPRPLQILRFKRNRRDPRVSASAVLFR